MYPVTTLPGPVVTSVVDLNKVLTFIHAIRGCTCVSVQVINIPGLVVNIGAIKPVDP